MTRELHNGMDIIDSRDVIARLKELEDERDNAKATEDTDADDLWTAENGEEFGANWTEEQEDEYQELFSLAEDASFSPDWKYGETLIRDSYFEDYARELAEDIGAIDRNATWLNNFIDWEAAADALKMDYTSVEFGNVTYWIRS